MISSLRSRLSLLGLATLALLAACAPDQSTSPSATRDASVAAGWANGTTYPPTYPPEVCTDPKATNYGEPLPCVYPPPPPKDDGEGCTPGYWKQRQHFGSWVGYTPGQDFDTIFGVDAFDPDLTLLEALWNGGGGIDALGRHAVAALLNSANTEVGNGMTTAQVIELVQDAINSGSDSAIQNAKNTLAALNERRCPLGRNP